MVEGILRGFPMGLGRPRANGTGMALVNEHSRLVQRMYAPQAFGKGSVAPGLHVGSTGRNPIPPLPHAMTDISRSINLMANCICAAGTAAVLNRGVSWLVCHDAPWARTDERERVFEGMRPAIAADGRKLHPNV